MAADARKVMLDTNIASFLIRGAPEPLRARLRAVPMASVCISAITEAELLYGVARRPEATALKTAVQAFLRHVDVLPWTSAAAAAYAELRSTLERQGTPMGNMDTLIAAHALAAQCLLVTNDKAFARVAGLIIEDWTSD
jgi:tRNA(fMet)-specific endonuclease VapC